jgi:hypothetical protein
MPRGVLVRRVLLGLAVAVAAAALYSELPAIKRELKIIRM